MKFWPLLWSNLKRHKTRTVFTVLSGIAVDGDGNIFFVDGDRIRKIDPGGIITTIAGTGGEGFSGDGGPALNATFYWPYEP